MNGKSTINKFPANSMMQYGTKDQISGQWKTGSCIMTVLQYIHCACSRLSWQNMEFHSFANLPTLQTWLETSGCFQNWKDPVSREEKRQCRTRRQRWTPFPKTPSRSVFSSGTISGRSVCGGARNLLWTVSLSFHHYMCSDAHLWALWH